MKIEINIDPKLKETLIKVFAKSFNQDVEMVQNIMEQTSVNRIVGLKENEVSILEPKNIIRFYTKGKKVFAETKNEEFFIRLRMYELEERFRACTFIRISQGELINLDYIKGLDLNYKGTIAVEFKTGRVSYVSRRNIKDFKKALGL